MDSKIIIIAIVLLVTVESRIHVKREVTTSTPEIFKSLKQDVEKFTHCVDQILTKNAGEISEKQIQPIFDLIGDQLNRVSKAITDLTAPKSTTPKDDFFDDD